MTMNRLQCDIQLQGCQPGHMRPKTMWPVAEYIVPQSRRLGVEVRIAIQPSGRRRDAGTPLTLGGSQQDHVDHKKCVLATCTLQGAVLDLAVVPSDSKHHVVVSALENAVLPGVHWTPPCRGRFHLFGASRWKRAISRRTEPDEVRGRHVASRFSVCTPKR